MAEESQRDRRFSARRVTINDGVKFSMSLHAKRFERITDLADRLLLTIRTIRTHIPLRRPIERDQACVGVEAQRQKQQDQDSSKKSSGTGHQYSFRHHHDTTRSNRCQSSGSAFTVSDSMLCLRPRCSESRLTQYYSTGCNVYQRGEAMPTGHTIGQIAKDVGVNIQTVRYYERLKLLSPTGRTASGYRLYGLTEVRRLRFIKNAQALGFTLQEIAELLNLWVSSVARCGDVRRKAEAKLDQVEAKVRDLQALARGLQGLVRTCRTGQPTDHCPILKALDKERSVHNGNHHATR
jgi:MerR family copper efflux transcriptional regulator